MFIYGLSSFNMIVSLSLLIIEKNQTKIFWFFFRISKNSYTGYIVNKDKMLDASMFNRIYLGHLILSDKRNENYLFYLKLLRFALQSLKSD